MGRTATPSASGTAAWMWSTTADVVGGDARTLTAVVPSLRVDVLGARAFKVSRAYFAKGVAAGNVLVGGAKAGKSASIEEGQEVHAVGLGRFRLVSVDGTTRRENLKVTLTVTPD